MKTYKVKVNDKVYEVQVESVTESSEKIAAPAAAPVQQAAPSAAPAGGQAVNAPMAGTINDVKVAVGQAVKKGDVLCILEAMKLENEIVCPCDGTVSSVLVSKGQAVTSGQKIVTIG
jgi:biotin carboxyl carrier protein